MKRTKKILGSVLMIGILSIGNLSQAYMFGIKSRDNSTSNIQRIEKEYELDIPIIAFIFDPWGPHVEKQLNELNDKL